MRKLLLSVCAAAAILAATALSPAQAMTPGTAAALAAAAAEVDALQEAAYVCRHRYWSSRRTCWWRPGFRWRWSRRR